MTDEVTELWLIEYRNGSFFQSLSAPHGVSADKARKFKSVRDVDAFVTRNESILMGGGCPVPVCPQCLRKFAFRGERCCTGR